MPSWSARTTARVSPGSRNPFLDAENFCFAQFTITQRVDSAVQRLFESRVLNGFAMPRRFLVPATEERFHPATL